MENKDPTTEYVISTLGNKVSYDDNVKGSDAFQASLKHLRSLSDDYCLTMTDIKFQGYRFNGQSTDLLICFNPLFQESAHAIETLIHDGKFGPARRELRFILETSVKCSAIDLDTNPRSLNDRISLLSESNKKMHEYVSDLRLFPSYPCKD